MAMMVLKNADKVYGKQQPAGHAFEAPDKEALVWGALGRAAPLQAQAANAPSAPSELDALRADFKAKTGNDADPAWSIGRLKNELRGGGRYNRRDMRAEG